MKALFGRRFIVRNISESGSSVYLTFDDGPTAETTEAVLDILGEAEARATFFVIGNRARKHQRILRRTLAEGHSVFSHSSDHNFFNYFRTPRFNTRWIRDSLAELQALSGVEQKLFRPPGGFTPPPVLIAAYRLNVPLVLWNHRFYDWVHPWTEERANRSLARVRGGDIVLLHDQQQPRNRDQFLSTLKRYLHGLQERHLNAEPLTTDLVLRQTAVRKE
jgi:peptidoglycan/xylan/chitin deacetylase (PgdA/CDA1 family)